MRRFQRDIGHRIAEIIDMLNERLRLRLDLDLVEMHRLPGQRTRVQMQHMLCMLDVCGVVAGRGVANSVAHQARRAKAWVK